MAMRWNNTGQINWPHLDRSLLAAWERRAGAASGVDRFVFGFIVVNHYYSAWAIASGARFRAEREEAIHLGTLPVLANWWPSFVVLHDVRGRRLSLPLEDRNNRPVPRDVQPGQYDAGQLTAGQWLNVVYQLRCDFFHAGRSPVGHDNELAVRFLADPVLALVRFLGMNTTAR